MLVSSLRLNSVFFPFFVLKPQNLFQAPNVFILNVNPFYACVDVSTRLDCDSRICHSDHIRHFLGPVKLLMVSK